MIGILKKLFSNSEVSDSYDECENELWVMIKQNEFFTDDAYLRIVDELAEIIENNHLGELDGHSSGAHQFEFNFVEVNSYNRCKKVVIEYFVANYPNQEYTISEEYETTYEHL